jgi:hypothetical protein
MSLMIRSHLMSRWTVLCLAALFATGDALAADQAPPARRAARAAAGKLPRAHYNTTVIVADPHDTETLISIPTTPLLPGSSSLPGYYGRAFSYNYQGAYYGGSSSYLPYFFRMPYACGVIGYC